MAFDESTVSRTQVQLWWPEHVDIEAMKKISLDNRRNTIKEVAEDVGISFGSFQATFMYVLGMYRAAVKIVPKLLHFVHKQRLMNIAQEMLIAFNDDPDLLKKVLTGDESLWVHNYNIATKA